MSEDDVLLSSGRRSVLKSLRWDAQNHDTCSCMRRKYAEINLKTLFIGYAFQEYGVKEAGHDLLTTRFGNENLFLLCIPLECHTTLHLICTLQTFTVPHQISPCIFRSFLARHQTSPVFSSLVYCQTKPRPKSPVLYSATPNLKCTF